MGDVLTFVPRATFVEEIREGLITTNIRAVLFAERKELIESRPHSWDLKFVCSILELPNPSAKRMSAKQISMKNVLNRKGTQVNTPITLYGYNALRFWSVDVGREGNRGTAR